MSDKVFDPHKYLIDIGTSLSDFEEVKLGDNVFCILGKGNFAYAEKMTSKKNSKVYAIKKLDKSKNKNSKNFIRETQISIELDHPNLIKFYGYFEDKESIDKYRYVYKDDKKRKVKETEDKEMYCLVLEFAENGSLKNYFKNYKEKNKTENSFVPIPQEFIIKILKESLDALKYLHENNIIHRDISLDNILLGENNTIKISDFGISAKMKDQNKYENKDDKVNEKEKKDEKILYSELTLIGRKSMVPPEIENRGNYDYRFFIA
jgi:serine/threonine protein kinase